MTGEWCEHSAGRREVLSVVIVPQKGAKVNISELIEDLKAQLQELEDAKVQISESQEHLRETIAELQMSEVKTDADS
jgi:ribosomal protein L9